MLSAAPRDGWEELRVDVDDPSSPERFSLVPRPASPDLFTGLPDVAAGARVPVQRAARRWVAQAHRLVGTGRIVAFDYGAETSELAQRSSLSDDPAAGMGWLRTHRDHHGGSEWLTEPGSCDITADVALDQVQADHRAEVCTQAEFLRSHGIDQLVAEGRAAWTDRAGVGDLAALKARSREREAEALSDPAGMGAFDVLVWTGG